MSQYIFSMEMRSPDGDMLHQFIVHVQSCKRPSSTKVWRRMLELMSDVDLNKTPLEGYHISCSSWHFRGSSSVPSKSISDVLGKSEREYILNFLQHGNK